METDRRSGPAASDGLSPVRAAADGGVLSMRDQAKLRVAEARRQRAVADRGAAAGDDGGTNGDGGDGHRVAAAPAADYATMEKASTGAFPYNP